MTAPLPLIDRFEVIDDTLTVYPSREFMDRFARSEFYATYDVGSEVPNLGEVSDGTAIIPFLANVLPVLWLSGEAWSIGMLDNRFNSAMRDLRAAYVENFPSLPWDGEIIVESTDEPTYSVESVHDVVLFSGGVDSFYTSTFATERPQILVTVGGSDIDLLDEKGWDSVRSDTLATAERSGHRPAFVRSNFRGFLDIPRLERLWPEVGDWWSRIQHGPGLLGLVAPLAPQGVGCRTFIASTHTEGFAHAWGSTPNLDECMRWGDVEVCHHGYDVSRQDKVGRLVSATSAQIELRVCYSNTFAGGGNCTRCEKCLRTAAAIMAEGPSPREFGLDVDVDVVAARVRRGFRWLLLPVSYNEVFMWTDIQQRLRVALAAENPTSAQVALAPLLALDLPAYRQRVRLIQSARKRGIRLVRGIPGLEALVKRVRAGVRRLLR